MTFDFSAYLEVKEYVKNNVANPVKIIAVSKNHPEKSIKTANIENNIKLIIKLAFPFFNSLSFFTNLEKSPKLTNTMEKYANIVPKTVRKGEIFDFEITLSITINSLNEFSSEQRKLKRNHNIIST